MPWEEVQRLRKAHRYIEAIQLGQRLKENDNGIQLKRQIAWSWYDLIKAKVAQIKAILEAGRQVPLNQRQELIQTLREYTRKDNIKKDSTLSNIVREISKIGHHLPEYPSFIQWVNIDGLTEEDWRYNERGGNVYWPVALTVARELAKWCKSHPDAEIAVADHALQWVDRIRPIARGDDALWVEWDRALLLRHRGDLTEAASSLSHVLKVKRNDSWVWTEAGRLYSKEQPDLALACFCRALLCPSQEQFTCNVHIDLAEILAKQGGYAQASYEINRAIAIRQHQGWRIPPELQALIDKEWYDPGAAATCDPQAFYAEHAPNALVLCFDKVQTVSGTYVGTIIPYQENLPPGKTIRPLPRFAFKDNKGISWSLVGPGLYVANLKHGDPVWLVKGAQEDGREVIVQLASRLDGRPWDCTIDRQGIVYGKSSNDGPIHVFLDRENNYVRLHETALAELENINSGDRLLLRVTNNPKRQRLEIVWAERGPVPEHPDIQPFSGLLRRNPKGFAFVDNIYVSQQQLETLPADISLTTGFAVYGPKPHSDDFGWSAITIRPE